MKRRPRLNSNAFTGLVLNDRLLEMSEVQSQRYFPHQINHQQMVHHGKIRLTSSVKQIKISTPSFRLALEKQQFIQSCSLVSIMNLTDSFLTKQWNIMVGIIWLLIVFVIRYYTMGCLIYVMVRQPMLWELIWVIIGCRLIYAILVIKVSLKRGQTKTQILLKSYWNSKQDSMHQLFAEIQIHKLLISLIRALTPPELSFLYITHTKKRFIIYSLINFIYIGIQMIIYYPFFIIYCAIIQADHQYSLNLISPNFTIFMATLAEVLILTQCVYLLYIGYLKYLNDHQPSNE